MDGRNLSISNGNSVELPAGDIAYDDSDIKKRLSNLEEKPDNDKQTLSINDRTISISNGNSIELPSDKDTIYDDTALKERINSLESSKTKVKGNGLLLDSDGTLHLELARGNDVLRPYVSVDGKHVNISPDVRSSKSIPGSLVYEFNNDGTPQKCVMLESGLVFDCKGKYVYKGNTTEFNHENIKLSLCSTFSIYVTGCVSALLNKRVKLEIFINTNWNTDNKVPVQVIPRVIWSVDNDNGVENYIHFITYEELDSGDSIEIELKKNEEVIGNLIMNIKNIKFFMQSVQGTTIAKNPDDNKFYKLPRSY